MPRSTITLEARDQQIAALAAQGVRQGIIAQQMGVHRHSIARRLAQARVQAAIARLQAEVFERNCALAADQFESVLARQHAAFLAKQAARAERRALTQARQALSRRPSQEALSPDPHQPIADYFLRQTQQQAQAGAIPETTPALRASWPP